MLLSCKRGCRKCCPNGFCGCCKPIQVQEQVNTTLVVQKAVEEKDTPRGYIFLYPGVRTSENIYTCPMLSIHLYHQSQHKGQVAQENRTVLLQGNNDQYTSQGPQSVKAQDKTTADEETIMIPVEDVVTIRSQLEIKKGLQADLESTTTPEYDFLPNRFDDCWDSMRRFCRENCCCCQEPNKIVPLVRSTTINYNDPNRDTEYNEIRQPAPAPKKGCFDPCRCCCCRKKILTALIKRTKVKKEVDAQRVITMTIEYSKYSNLNTPSHTRLLSNQHQIDYYKQKFDANEKKVKFYLVNNTEFDPANFELKKAEAETLCRTVMQLKGMKDNYPSERQLEEILSLSHKRSFGDRYTEPTLQISVDSITAASTTQNARSTLQIPGAPKRAAIEQPIKPKVAASEAVRSTTGDDDFE